MKTGFPFTPAVQPKILWIKKTVNGNLWEFLFHHWVYISVPRTIKYGGKDRALKCFIPFPSFFLKYYLSLTLSFSLVFWSAFSYLKQFKTIFCQMPPCPAPSPSVTLLPYASLFSFLFVFYEVCDSVTGQVWALGKESRHVSVLRPLSTPISFLCSTMTKLILDINQWSRSKVKISWGQSQQIPLAPMPYFSSTLFNAGFLNSGLTGT